MIRIAPIVAVVLLTASLASACASRRSIPQQFALPGLAKDDPARETCPRLLQDEKAKASLTLIDQLIVFTTPVNYQGVYRVTPSDAFGLADDQVLRVDCKTLRLLAVAKAGA